MIGMTCCEPKEYNQWDKYRIPGDPSGGVKTPKLIHLDCVHGCGECGVDKIFPGVDECPLFYKYDEDDESEEDSGEEESVVECSDEENEESEEEDSEREDDSQSSRETASYESDCSLEEDSQSEEDISQSSQSSYESNCSSEEEEEESDHRNVEVSVCLCVFV